MDRCEMRAEERLTVSQVGQQGDEQGLQGMWWGER